MILVLPTETNYHPCAVWRQEFIAIRVCNSVGTLCWYFMILVLPTETNYHPCAVWRQEFIAIRVCNSVWFHYFYLSSMKWAFNSKVVSDSFSCSLVPTMKMEPLGYDLTVRWICLQEGCPNSVGALDWTGLDWTGLDYIMHTCLPTYLPWAYCTDHG